MWYCAALALLVAYPVLQVNGAPLAKHPIATIQEQGLTLFEKLITLAGAHDALSSPKAHVTLFAPTDEAIKAFLHDMGINWANLQQNEALVDAIVAYHTVLGSGARPRTRGSNASGRIVAMTVAEPYKLLIKKVAEDTWIVKDFQGNVAHLTQPNLGQGNHTLHILDSVLYSGDYCPSFAKLFTRLPNHYSTVQAVFAKAHQQPAAQCSGGTMFLPTNAAFKAAGVSLNQSAVQLATLIKYHTIIGQQLSIPGGFRHRSPVATQAGPALSVTYKQEGGVHKLSGMTNSAAYVTLAGGTTAKCLSHNMFVGKCEVQVIDNVLTPTAAGTAAAAAIHSANPAAGTAVTSGAARQPAGGSSKAGKTVSIPALGLTISLPFGKGASVLPSVGEPHAQQRFGLAYQGGRRLTESPGKSDGVHGPKDGEGADQRDEYDYTQQMELNAEDQAIYQALNSHGTQSTVQTAAADGLDDLEYAGRFAVSPSGYVGEQEASVALSDNDPGFDNNHGND